MGVSDWLRLFILGPLVVVFAFSCGKSPTRKRPGDLIGGATQYVENFRPPIGPSAGESQGGWESSGGDGVACFATEAEASVAREEIKKSGSLSSGTRGKIQSAQTLDFLENVTDKDEYLEKGQIAFSFDRYFKNERLLISPDLKGLKSRDEILEKVLRQLELDVPLFAERIRALQKRFPLKEWRASAEVPAVDDSKPKIKLEKNCVLIQLANRYTRSVSGKIPETRIVYDQEIFEKFLSPLDQAVLVLHEYLYEIGKEGGHADSNFLRRLNIFFFSREFSKDQKPSPSWASLMRNVLNQPYGDYMRFFLKEEEFKPAAGGFQEGTQESRYRSLISLMFKLRAKKAACMNEGREGPQCLDQIFQDGGALKKALNREEAFLFLTRFSLDRTASKPFNSEHLVVRQLETEHTSPEALRNQIGWSCKALSEKPPLAYVGLANLALEYCQVVLNQPVSPFSARPVEHKANCSLGVDFKTSAIARFSGPKDNLRVLLETEKSGSDGSTFSEVPLSGRLLTFENISNAFKHDGGSIAYSARHSYYFENQATAALFTIQKFVALHPLALKSIDVVQFELVHGKTESQTSNVSGPEALGLLAGKTEKQIVVTGVTLEFSYCAAVETNLPYGPRDFVWGDDFFRIQKYKVLPDGN